MGERQREKRERKKNMRATGRKKYSERTEERKRKKWGDGNYDKIKIFIFT